MDDNNPPKPEDQPDQASPVNPPDDASEDSTTTNLSPVSPSAAEPVIAEPEAVSDTTTLAPISSPPPEVPEEEPSVAVSPPALEVPESPSVAANPSPEPEAVANPLATEQDRHNEVLDQLNRKRSKKPFILGLAGLLFSAGLAAVAYTLFFSPLNKQAAFDSMLNNLGDSSYMEVTQRIDSGFFEGTLTGVRNVSDVTSPTSRGTFEYTVAFFGNADVSEEFVADKDTVLAKFTKAEVNGEAQTEEDLTLPLNQWIKVAEGGTITVSDFVSSQAAYAFNGALGVLPMGKLDSEARSAVATDVRAAMSYDEAAVTEEDLDGQATYKYPVTFDVEMLLALNERLVNEFNVFASDNSYTENESNYFDKAELYVNKETGRLVRMVATVGEGEQATTLSVSYMYLNTAPDIQIPEAEFTPEPTEESSQE